MAATPLSLPRLPAEWEKQKALMITWAHAHGLWAPDRLVETEKVLVNIAAITSHYQPLIIACYDEAHQQHIKAQLEKTDANLDQMHFYIVPSNDSWTRDHGPITLHGGGKTYLGKFQFNAWGSKYTYDLDDNIVPTLASEGAFWNYPIKDFSWVLEGGSLDTNGQRTLLTTESCLLNPNRNPTLSREDIETRLRQDLGIERVHWIKNSTLSGDDTDGHIDMLARFCDSNTICYSTPYPQSADWNSLSAMEEELRAFRNERGEPYTLISLPAIAPKLTAAGVQMPASYANFLIINGAVIVPTYGDKNDAAALECIQHCFPNRKIYGVNSLALIHNHGSIHCTTMNIYLEE